MFIVKSTIAQRFPKLGLDLRVGVNGFATLSDEQRAALAGIKGVVSIVEEPPPAPPKITKAAKAKAEAAVKALLPAHDPATVPQEGQAK